MKDRTPRPCKICGTVREIGTRCKVCEKRRHDAWYAKNREKKLAYCKERYYADPKAKLSRNKAWQQSNREKCREYTRKWKTANAATYPTWYSRNKERHRTNAYAWRAANPERVSIDRDRRRAYVRRAIGTHTAEEWLAVLKKYGRKCVICGSKKRLTKDHIIPLARGGTNFAYNLQPLCKSCNCRKRDNIEVGVQHSIFDRLRDTA